MMCVTSWECRLILISIQAKVTLTQVSLTQKVLNIVGMLDINNKITQEATNPMGTYDDVTIFDEPW